MKLELGGGTKPRGHGFLNLDCLPCADVVIDFETGVLPFPDDSVTEVFSSHCLEHVKTYSRLLHEVVRVCVLGARVELRVPAWNSSMAMCCGHCHTISPQQVQHWVKDATQDWWQGCKKRLALVSTEVIPSSVFPAAQAAFPNLTREQVLQFVPDSAHEIVYVLKVVPND